MRKLGCVHFTGEIPELNDFWIDNVLAKRFFRIRVIIVFYRGRNEFLTFELENGNLVKEGKYELSTIKSIYSGQLETAISFNEVDALTKEIRKYVVSLRKDSLFLSDNYYDGYSTLYLRVK